MNQSEALYHDDESRYPWLKTLLDTCRIMDAGIAAELQSEEKRRCLKSACRKGCDNCCYLFPNIPVSPLEAKGIAWFLNGLEGEIRGKIKNELKDARLALKCPFLSDSICHIYPVRPIACRALHIFGEPCLEGENVLLTRPEDVYFPSRELSHRIVMSMLPYYDVNDEREKEMAFSNGFIYSISGRLYELTWEKLMSFLDA